MDESDELEGVYDQYFRDVYIFVLSLSRDEQIAEEITQETFFKALKRIEQFRGDCKMSVWLCQIAKNTYFSYMDGQRRFASLAVQEEEGSINLEQKLIDQTEALRVHKVLVPGFLYPANLRFRFSSSSHVISFLRIQLFGFQ